MTDERWYRAEEYPGEDEGHEAWEFYEPRGYVVQTFVNKGYSREPAHNGALWFMRIRRPAPPAEVKPFGDNAAIRAVIEERDDLLEERQRFEARLFNMAETGDQARAERDALRVLLAAARGYMLGAGDGYENEVIVAIDAALKETKP